MGCVTVGLLSFALGLRLTDAKLRQPSEKQVTYSSPIFFFDYGESTVTSDDVASYLTESSGPVAPMGLARQYNGLAILWEHRFYGESLPFPMDGETGLAKAGWGAYKYLTTEQALEDTIYFANNFQPAGLQSSWDQMKPSKSPWIWIGGSYPGARAAWIRKRNPETFYASWASSAPVEATVDFSEYYEQVSRDMTANCSADIRAAAGYFDSVMKDGSQQEQTMTQALLYLIQNGTYVNVEAGLTDTDFDSQNNQMREYAADAGDLYSLANVLENVIDPQFQYAGFADSLMLKTCNTIETFDPEPLLNSTNFSYISQGLSEPRGGTIDPTDAGIAATYGAKAAYYSVLSALWNGYGGSYNLERRDGSSEFSVDSDQVSWTWQMCSEYGFYDLSNPSSEDNLLSGFINQTSYQTTICDSWFPYSQLPSPANVSTVNSKYLGWNINPSNVMFTNGLKDPWHTLGVQSNSSSIGAPNRETVQDVPACNQAPAEGTVFGLTFPNAYHVSDLTDWDNDNGIAEQNLQPSLDLFGKALETWLPCFETYQNSVETSKGVKNGAERMGMRGLLWIAVAVTVAWTLAT